jgi:hypothetical protein
LGAIALRVDSSVKTAQMLTIYTFYQFEAPLFSEFVRNPGLTAVSAVMLELRTILCFESDYLELSLDG